LIIPPSLGQRSLSGQNKKENGVEKRTPKQNNALHKYFELLAEELNNAGLDMRHTLKESIEIPWTPELVKDYLFKPVMRATLGKESTTELDRKEVSTVYDVLNRYLGQRFGLDIFFPSEDSRGGNASDGAPKGGAGTVKEEE
jgi:hypothetical protein